MMFLRILAEIILLVTGRRLFWFFVGLLGFVSGIRIATHFFPVSSLLHVSGWRTSGIGWILILAGGILGTLLIIVLFHWALIILSSLAGAALIPETVHLDRGVATALFIALVIAGMVVQSYLMKPG